MQVWEAVTATWRVLRAVVDMSSEAHLGLIAAGVAFFGIFAIFPGLAALIALFGLLADPSVVESQLSLMQDIIPDDAYALIDGQISRLLETQTGTLGWATGLSVGVALWSARAGVGALIQGLNAIQGSPNRSGILHALVALSMTLVLMGIAITALMVVVVAPIGIALVPMAQDWAWVIEAVRWGVALFVLLSALGILYRFGPNRQQRHSSLVTPGAILVVVLWLGMSVAFSYYLTNFGSYNQVYGSIGAVIAMLMWLYISAYLVLLGAALNLVIETGPAIRPGHGTRPPPEPQRVAR